MPSTVHLKNNARKLATLAMPNQQVPGYSETRTRTKPSASWFPLTKNSLVLTFAFSIALPIQAVAATRNYDYTVQLVSKAQVQGKVRIGKVDWLCQENVCTARGPWPTPSARACNALAKKAGPVMSYGHPGKHLGRSGLKTCNKGVRLTKSAPRLSAKSVQGLQTLKQQSPGKSSTTAKKPVPVAPTVNAKRTLQQSAPAANLNRPDALALRDARMKYRPKPESGKDPDAAISGPNPQLKNLPKLQPLTLPKTPSLRAPASTQTPTSAVAKNPVPKLDTLSLRDARVKYRPKPELGKDPDAAISGPNPVQPLNIPKLQPLNVQSTPDKLVAPSINTRQPESTQLRTLSGPGLKPPADDKQKLAAVPKLQPLAVRPNLPSNTAKITGLPATAPANIPTQSNAVREKSARQAQHGPTAHSVELGPRQYEIYGYLKWADDCHRPGVIVVAEHQETLHNAGTEYTSSAPTNVGGGTSGYQLIVPARGRWKVSVRNQTGDPYRAPSRDYFRPNCEGEWVPWNVQHQYARSSGSVETSVIVEVNDDNRRAVVSFAQIDSRRRDALRQIGEIMATLVIHPACPSRSSYYVTIQKIDGGQRTPLGAQRSQPSRIDPKNHQARLPVSDPGMYEIGVVDQSGGSCLFERKRVAITEENRVEGVRLSQSETESRKNLKRTIRPLGFQSGKLIFSRFNRPDENCEVARCEDHRANQIEIRLTVGTPGNTSCPIPVQLSIQSEHGPIKADADDCVWNNSSRGESTAIVTFRLSGRGLESGTWKWHFPCCGIRGGAYLNSKLLPNKTYQLSVRAGYIEYRGTLKVPNAGSQRGSQQQQYDLDLKLTGEIAGGT